MADPVELTDLEVIARFSLAVRSATADRDEVIAALRADLDWLQHAGPGRPGHAEPAAPVPTSAVTRRSGSRPPAVKKATARLRKA